MVNAFAWLNDLMTWLGKWFPRLVLVKAGNEGVLFTARGGVRPRRAGLHCYWPLIQDLTIVSTRQRTLELCAQLHGSEVVAIVVTYRIVSPCAALLALNDVRAFLDDRTQAALTEAYCATSSAEQIAVGVRERLHAIFWPLGLEIINAQVAQRGWALPLKNISDWATHESDEA